jgi:two-component system, sensor histidine kinase
LVTIKRNAFNLTKLLGEILDLAKIEAGHVSVDKIYFSIPALVSEVVTALELQAREKAISLKFEIKGAFPEFVNSDPTKIRQVITNLIANALKFTQRGGVEIVAIARARANEDESVFLEFTVRDSGIGLDKEQQSRLFEAFMQADTTTTRKFGGTGLGLNLSKKLIESLGGNLHLVSSEIGIGSTFQFTFDAGKMKESSLNYKTPQKLKGLQIDGPPKFSGELLGMNVLLVEDSPDNQLLFSRYLKNTGANVDIANDGVEGVRLARKLNYDAILMDVQMPNLDGYDATKILRDDGFTVPIVALTAHALREDQERALSNGFTAYLTKPIDPVLLVTTLVKFKKLAKELVQS